jgi:hypothetical protein
MYPLCNDIERHMWGCLEVLFWNARSWYGLDNCRYSTGLIVCGDLLSIHKPCCQGIQRWSPTIYVAKTNPHSVTKVALAFLAICALNLQMRSTTHPSVVAWHRLRQISGHRMATRFWVFPSSLTQHVGKRATPCMRSKSLGTSRRHKWYSRTCSTLDLHARACF